MPATILTNVDLPAPFSPTIACTRPPLTVRSTSFKTVVLPYLFVRPLATSVVTTHTHRSTCATRPFRSALALRASGRQLCRAHPPRRGDVLDERTEIRLIDGQRCELEEVLAVDHLGWLDRRRLARSHGNRDLRCRISHLLDWRPPGHSLPARGDQRQALLARVGAGSKDLAGLESSCLQSYR